MLDTGWTRRADRNGRRERDCVLAAVLVFDAATAAIHTVYFFPSFSV